MPIQRIIDVFPVLLLRAVLLLGISVFFPPPATSVWAQSRTPIYKWVDNQGHTHYGGIPPPGTAVQEIDLGQSTMSTIGDSGLRDAEKDLLEYYAEAARIRLEEQQSAPSPPVVVVTPPPDPQQAERDHYYIPIWRRWPHRPHKPAPTPLPIRPGSTQPTENPDPIPSPTPPLEVEPEPRPTYQRQRMPSARIEEPERTLPPALLRRR